MLSVTYKPLMLIVIMLNVVMLSVVAPLAKAKPRPIKTFNVQASLMIGTFDHKNISIVQDTDH
jgi:hypothetical protein